MVPCSPGRVAVVPERGTPNDMVYRTAQVADAGLRLRQQHTRHARWMQRPCRWVGDSTRATANATAADRTLGGMQAEAAPLTMQRHENGKQTIVRHQHGAFGGRKGSQEEAPPPPLNAGRAHRSGAVPGAVSCRRSSDWMHDRGMFVQLYVCRKPRFHDEYQASQAKLNGQIGAQAPFLPIDRDHLKRPEVACMTARQGRPTASKTLVVVWSRRGGLRTRRRMTECGAVAAAAIEKLESGGGGEMGMVEEECDKSRAWYDVVYMPRYGAGARHRMFAGGGVGGRAGGTSGPVGLSRSWAVLARPGGIEAEVEAGMTTSTSKLSSLGSSLRGAKAGRPKQAGRGRYRRAAGRRTGVGHTKERNAPRVQAQPILAGPDRTDAIPAKQPGDLPLRASAVPLSTASLPRGDASGVRPR
ncbi:uncharacterized protein PSFLO_00918 [Pseudozyma flocculosa]|uniref:Uncharacterized protein n=1 Tax=Pseudozyma flocculosa TaxID=84751 RepID=A0A5C3EVC9_9BASI|nr:uncharacterized protein PSFLO_00918 [Pseudozyma flocculosa]